MASFLDDILEDNIDILVTKPMKSHVFTFSNSGRGGKRNWFAMTASQLSGCLEDILESSDEFPSRYHEKEWRQLFSDNLTDDVARTMGAVQTLPLFEILAKIIHYSNTSGPRSFKTMNVDRQAIRQSIAMLSKIENS